MSVKDVFTDLKFPFWLANLQEAGERLAYFGVRAVLPLMMVSVGTGGLGLSMSQKGLIYGIWALLQCLIPMVSGGFSESFGYKKSLIVAFIINIIGYLIMGNILPIAEFLTGSSELDVATNFALMMTAGCTIGIGTAIFKPPVQGIVAKSVTKKSSSIGFAIFYWIVNIGGFIAPMAASALRGPTEAPTWSYVFYGAAFVTLFNLLITIFLFKEPKRTEAEIAKQKKATPVKVFIDTIATLVKDRSMLFFLLIISGFWLMFMQLWDLLPNFLDEWVDRRDVGGLLQNSSFFQAFIDSDGSLKPEMIINIDSAAIILLVLPLSALFSKFKMMTSLIVGMVISIVGFIMSGMTMSGTFACVAVFTFAIGEIICSPKFNEYIGMTAPADKKAIYMGFGNIPFAIGWAAGNLLSGPLYDIFSSRSTLATRYLVEHGVDASTLAGLDQMTLMSKVQEQLGGVDVYAANKVLWDAYNPWIIWIILGAFGTICLVGMIIFYFNSDMSKKENAAEQNEANPEAENLKASLAEAAELDAYSTEPKDEDDAHTTDPSAEDDAQA